MLLRACGLGFREAVLPPAACVCVCCDAPLRLLAAAAVTGVLLLPAFWARATSSSIEHVPEGGDCHHQWHWCHARQAGRG